jgi:hypothetical protein
MPLDSALKIAHVQAMVRKAWTGRQQVVVFVSLVSGVWTYTAQTVIFRRQEVVDPEIPDLSGGAPKMKGDALMIVDIAISMVGVVYVAYTATATSGAVQNADKYEIIESTPTGIIPGGTHYVVDLRRWRG